ncbi:leucyl aminopeptidase family protein [Roseomonas xinghualingensis]|uniref:leucyl aminopeptidase family protein n=1 Tax=Roseomonas xinghualingensis TaxID=2986475 RepID=UPI0021F142DD|nr:leucyl aminopeptidase family protein [Roseomonas sp. SXEYE001]MCV4208365.1 leucyl aminopeptidase family protein [Roseomonas sp. SXEYE001]
MPESILSWALTEPGVSARPIHATTPDALPTLLGRLDPGMAAFLRESGFRAETGQVVLLPGKSGISAAVMGLGQNTGSPWPYGALPFGLPEGTAWYLGEGCEPEAALLGWMLGAYRFTRHKAPRRKPAQLIPPGGTEQARVLAEATIRARDLINLPAADLGPAELADAARGIAERCGADFEEITGEALAGGFPAIAAVGGGSHRAPRVAVLRWEGAADGPLIALLGKGVCFDTGGLDLKSPDGMKRMKKDMGGAAIILGLAEALMRLHAPVRLLIAIGAVENAISSTAMRPLDVLRTRAGLTVEVGNTDAEGRLVLADLLAFAGEQSPALILDAATLTGAARVALGPDLPALFTNDNAVAAALSAAGDACHDPLWRLPLHEGYASWLDSSAADINNIGSRPMAGSIVAALFLRRFVPEGIRWAHLDVYAWNDIAKPGRPEGGEAMGLRALHAGLMALLPRWAGPRADDPRSPTGSSLA